MSEQERTPDQIEQDIEATRERMSRDIDELGDRLSPDNLKRQAKEAITGKAHDMVNSVGAGARRTGFRMMDFIQENTSLVAAMGLGAVWLIQQRNRSEISGDRMAADFEPDSAGPWGGQGGHVEGDIAPGNVLWGDRGGIETAVNVGKEPFYEIVVELK